MKVIIKKELCNPKDGEPVGPYYHVGIKEDDRHFFNELGKFTDIGEAARFAERQLDLNVLEVAYKDNPNSFRSVIDNAQSVELSPEQLNEFEESLYKNGWMDLGNGLKRDKHGRIAGGLKLTK